MIKNKILLSFIVFLLVTGNPLANYLIASQAQVPNTDTLSKAKKEEPSVTRDPAIRIKNLTTGDKKRFNVGDRLEMSIRGAPELLKNTEKELLLYINGLPMEGLHPVARPNLGKDSSIKLSFVLERNRDSIATFKAWDRFYRYPRQKEYPVKFSVGTANQELSPQSGGNTLELVKQSRLSLVVLSLVLLTALFLVLAKRSNILKEDKPNQVLVYSLARTQIAWWTIIVLGSFLHLYVYTDELIDLSNSTLVLMGVSAATLVSGTLIDYYKTPTPDPTNLQSTTQFHSRGFLLDILSDGKAGVSIHRFQFVVWTLALSYVFIRGVLKDLAMPTFPDNLLLLMGISNSTYLLLKIPENTAPSTPVDSSSNATAADPVKPDDPAKPDEKESTETPVSSVTAEGDVIYRQEDDMGLPEPSNVTDYANPPGINRALG